MIRVVVGLFVMMAAAGTSDNNYEASLLLIAAMAFGGMAIFAWGALSEIQKQG